MKILIVDDEKAIRNAFQSILQDEGYEADTADNGVAALEMTGKENYEVIFCDIKMPGMDGTEVLKKLVENGTESAIVMISGHADIETAVDCIKNGAFDFIQKPLDLNRILITLKNATERTKITQQNTFLKKKVYGQDEIVGESPEIQAVNAMIEKVAVTDARVLITGPNGSGKELVARKIHKLSARAGMPYIDVNCAAIPADLIESELFGHEKGSFTSAIKQHKGKFEQAQDGTLFLDEIGDMSLAAQAKMLRVLQEKKLTRVGGDKDIDVNVRVIAATNKNLQEEIAAGRFREDLYHRLSVIVVKVPALNERVSDIPLLVDHFIKTISSESGLKPLPVESEAIAKLQQKNWSGNIRELRNVVERLLILCSDKITAKDIEQYV